MTTIRDLVKEAENKVNDAKEILEMVYSKLRNLDSEVYELIDSEVDSIDEAIDKLKDAGNLLY